MPVQQVQTFLEPGHDAQLIGTHWWLRSQHVCRLGQIRVLEKAAAFGRAVEMMQSGDFDLIVLDEINIALRYDYLDVQAVIAGLEARADHTSVILTGRDAKSELMDYADLVSEMVERRHPSNLASRHSAESIFRSIVLIDRPQFLDYRHSLDGAPADGAKRESGENPELYPQL